MEEVRNTSSTYEISNIYDMHESVLFPCIGPSRTYLSVEEFQQENRGTTMKRHKRVPLLYSVWLLIDLMELL